MPSGYFAGVWVEEIPTSIVPPVRSANPVVAFGTSVNAVSEPKLIWSFDEYKETFGYDGDYSKHTLDEVADVFFKLYKVAPVVFVSVGQDATATTFKDDVINALTILNEIFPRYRMVPGLVIAPLASEDPSVAVALASNTEVVSSVFKTRAVADIPDSVAPSDVPGYKNNNNLADDNLILTYPKVVFNDIPYHLSVHYAAAQARLNAQLDAPYKIASNINVAGVKPTKWLTLEQANYLRGNGILTLLNFIGGLRFWGDRTSIYPASTDPKDCQIVVRQMTDWLRERLIRTYWQFVDKPLNPRLLKTIRDSVQSDLNGLAGRGIIISGRVEVLDTENPVTDLMDGIVRFHIYWTPSPVAREIDFYVEFDPEGLKQLFQA
jgi:hypothetical protein